MTAFQSEALWERSRPSVEGLRQSIFALWPIWSASDPEQARRTCLDRLREIAGAVAPRVALDLLFRSDEPSCVVSDFLSCHVSARCGEIRIVIDDGFFSPDGVRLAVAHRLAAVVPLLAMLAERHPTGGHTVFALSLGDDATGSDVGFCARDACLLIPDSDFLGSGGHAAFRRQAGQRWLPWRSREAVVFWRGSTTGERRPPGSYDPESEWFRVLPRTELCARLRASHLSAFCDVGVSGIVQIGEAALAARIATQLRRGHVDRIDQIRFQHHIDIDGNTNAWSGLQQALILGGCVLKVTSPGGHRQWYYGALEPWRTHVPIAADLSDLEERVEWALGHPSAAERIAAEGCRLVLSMSYEESVAAAVDAILVRFGR